MQIVVAAQAAAGADQTGQVHPDLIATRARVELIGGSLQMSAMPGGETRIAVEIPIAPEGD